MTIHNNIVRMNLVENEITKKYFRYIKVCTVFNMWGTQMEALNGCDYDSDAIITTDNPVLLRTTRTLLTVICEQNSAKKHKITESLLAKSNKNGFNNNVGIITNRCTAMFDVLAKFEKGTKEYNEMLYRITCMQGYQQEIIDSCKGIIPKQVPREWYDYRTVKDIDDGGYTLSLLANKKPYFFIYNYKHLRNDLKKHNENFETNCEIVFGITLDELKSKENKTDDEKGFLNYYSNKTPVSFANSTMNRICWKLEEELDGLQKALKDIPFDTSIFTTNKKVSKKLYNQAEELYEDYKTVVRRRIRETGSKTGEEAVNSKLSLMYLYKEKLEELFKGDYELITNCLVDMLYNKPVSKQFVWGVCKEYMINKLLSDNNNKINIPVESNEGIEWQGVKYSIVKEEVD